MFDTLNNDALQCVAPDGGHLCEPSVSTLQDISSELNSTATKLENGSNVLMWSSAVLFNLLLIFEAVEIYNYYRRSDSASQRDENEKISKENNSLKHHIQLICHILLAIVFPTAWNFEHFSFTDSRESFIHHSIRCSFHLMSWSLAFILSYKASNQPQTTTSILRRGSVQLLVCFVAGFDRCLWWANTEAINSYKLVIFILEILTILATVSFRLDQEAFEWQLISEQETGKDGSKPARSLGTKFALILPYLWPKAEKAIKLRVVGCFAIMLIGRAINIYMPLNNKKIVDSLTYPNGSTNKLDFRWDLIVLYAVMEVVNDNVLSPMQDMLWMGVEQFTSCEAQVKLYEHLLNLSLRFHVERKTGEVLQVMDRGIGCINGLFSYLLFNSVPVLADITISAIMFTSTYDYRFVSIAFVTTVLYTLTSVLVSRWREKQMKETISADDDFSAMGVDSLLNFETVKYYNAEDYETQRYRNALEKSNKATLKSNKYFYIFNALENIITGSGLLIGSLLCAYMVTRGDSNITVGDYILFATYMSQLTSPLCMLQYMYLHIKESLLEMDKMFDIMEEKPEVSDHPEAVDFISTTGKIEFKNVTFGFAKDQPVLKDVSFCVEPGKTLAFVGPSGAGKSTVIRLLFRFYDSDSGQILFDDQDITKVKQKSLRRYMGVVPQDTVLFNDSIRYNIRYGRVDASDDEIIEAAKAANIHKTIIGFTDGYDAQVGERGLKLSGGEKQRVAIARTILKSPSFVFLDEATSALDTHTERNIQASLQQACAGKTTVVIAHRLSTIIGADEIIVLKEGRIAERGSHNDLLALKDLYFSMWMQQLSPEKLVTSETVSSESK